MDKGTQREELIEFVLKNLAASKYSYFYAHTQLPRLVAETLVDGCVDELVPLSNVEEFSGWMESSGKSGKPNFYMEMADNHSGTWRIRTYIGLGDEPRPGYERVLETGIAFIRGEILEEVIRKQAQHK